MNTKILSKKFYPVVLFVILPFALVIQSCHTTKYTIDYKEGGDEVEKFVGKPIRIKNLASGKYITIINEKVFLAKLDNINLKSQVFILGQVDDATDPKLFVLQHHDENNVLRSGSSFSLAPFTADLSKLSEFGIKSIGNEKYTLINTPILKQDQGSKEKLKVQWTADNGNLTLAYLFDTSNPAMSTQFWEIEVAPDNWNKKDEPIFYDLTYDIQCVKEDDGTGNAEEIFGEIYVKTESGTKILWSKAENNAVDIDEGTTYSEDNSYLFSLKEDDTFLTIGGHLYEEDTDGDDDLGKDQRRFGLKNFLNKEANMVFTHDDTKINVNYSVKKANGKYFTIDSIICIKPSYGTDKNTELFLDIMATVGAASAHGLAESAHIDPILGTTVVEALIALRNENLAKVIGERHPGADQFFLEINGKHVWPKKDYIEVNSHERYFIGKTWKINDGIRVKLNEYDSASKDDSLGEWNFYDHPEVKVDVYVFKEDEEEEPEGSIYELIFTVKEYKDGYLIQK